VPALGQWYHLAAVYDHAAHTITLRINDGAVGSQTTPFTGPVFNSVTPRDLLLLHTYIGNFLYGNNAIDELGIWNRALTGAEITALYNGGAGRSYPF
jgi:hypothetical protein